MRVYISSGQAKGVRTSNALVSEFQVLIIAMQNYRKVIFEGDSKGVVDLNGTKLNFRSFNWIQKVKLRQITLKKLNLSGRREISIFKFSIVTIQTQFFINKELVDK